MESLNDFGAWTRSFLSGQSEWYEAIEVVAVMNRSADAVPDDVVFQFGGQTIPIKSIFNIHIFS